MGDSPAENESICVAEFHAKIVRLKRLPFRFDSQTIFGLESESSGNIRSIARLIMQMGHLFTDEMAAGHLYAYLFWSVCVLLTTLSPLANLRRRSEKANVSTAGSQKSLSTPAMASNNPEHASPLGQPRMNCPPFPYNGFYSFDQMSYQPAGESVSINKHRSGTMPKGYGFIFAARNRVEHRQR